MTRGAQPPTAEHVGRRVVLPSCVALLVFGGALSSCTNAPSRDDAHTHPDASDAGNVSADASVDASDDGNAPVDIGLDAATSIDASAILDASSDADSGFVFHDTFDSTGLACYPVMKEYSEWYPGPLYGGGFLPCSAIEFWVTSDEISTAEALGWPCTTFSSTAVRCGRSFREFSMEVDHDFYAELCAIEAALGPLGWQCYIGE